MNSDEFVPFGSDLWLVAQARRILQAARDAHWAECRRHVPLPASTPVDFDAYSHIIMSRNQRKINRLLAEATKDMDGLNYSYQFRTLLISVPSGLGASEGKYTEHDGNVAAVEVLRRNGIDCTVDIRFRG